MKPLPLIVAIFCLLNSLHVAAQVERVLPRRGASSLEGTSFIVGFMQNELLEVGIDPRLQIFISSQFDATVRISSPFSGESIVTVPANSVHVESVHVYHVNNASEVPQRKSLFITSDVPIVVYVLNTLAQSTDTYAAIPIRHLGTQYYSINRPSDRYKRNRNPTSTMLRSGEFMVMAVEDGTQVDITPTTTTMAGVAPNTMASVILNRGDCYLVQAKPTAYGKDDLTGSSITSSKPVALISGHMRSSIPLDSGSSKDHLVEQLPPATKWGKSYATAPFALSGRPDVLRIMASMPNQTVTVTTRLGTRTWNLPNIGSYVDTSLAEPASWSSPDPFFLVQHMSSQNGVQTNCDPAMVIAPPIEQYVNESLFRFPTLERVASNASQRFYYFINLLATPEALPSLMIGARSALSLAPQLANQVVPGTTIHWAQVRLQEGSFLMTCDSGTFSAVMYGTSDADSYANLVGIAFDPIRRRDITPPVYELTLDCGTVSGRIADVSKDSAHLKDVTVVGASTFNYQWTISNPIDSFGTVNFDAIVRDLTKDAQIVIQAYDDRGNGREWLYRYDAPSIDVARDVLIDARRGRQGCTTIVVRNRDSTPVFIKSLLVQGNQRFVVASPKGSFAIRPRDSAFVTICATQWADSTAMAATIVIQLPCGLTRNIFAKTRLSASLKGDSIDLGDVRLGDTACGRVAIVNGGDKPVDVEQLVSTRIDTSFVVDTARLGLPRFIGPGDTLWVDVCFVARREGAALRRDSVVSDQSDEAILTYRARGVRPQVGSIIIDWRERRLGSVNDTTFWIRNTGSGWCVATGDLSGLPASLIVSSDKLVKGARMAAGDSVLVSASFRPNQRGTLRHVVPIAIDWSQHAPVTIEFRGVGIMPDIFVRDIDFDSVVVNTTRDSLAGLVSTGFDRGNTDLKVYSVTIVGPDSSAFTIPESLRGLAGRSIPLMSILSDVVSFTPGRLGRHVCTIDIEHDASPQPGVHEHTRFRLLVVGVPLPQARPVVAVKTKLRVRACTDEPVILSIRNDGTARAVIDSVYLVARSSGISVFGNLDGTAKPRYIDPGQSWSDTVTMQWDTLTPYMVTLGVIDSAGNVYSDSVEVVVESGYASVSMQILGAPLLTAGPAWITTEAILPDVQAVPVQPAMHLLIERDRFVVDVSDSTSVYLERNGVTRKVDAEITQSQGAILIRLRDQVPGPWKLTGRLYGTMIWNDPDARECIAVLDGTPCFRQSASPAQEFRVDPCGSRLRMVEVGTRPGVFVEPLGHPFASSLSVRVTASVATHARVWLESLSGQHFPLSEHLSLQKGSQHCNFSCSNLASGVYRLVVSHEYGVEVTNIIIVN
ncbi:MAG: hypothetical protein FGM32_04110 [Candidatus Kapabacteria bacterium]|nr:hypothetical protein [Candidatus Kapabacteria bacterium]